MILFLALSCGALPATVRIENWGDPDMEGHTPDSFAGMGAGLFSSDDLTEDFAPGVVTRILLSFDLDALPGRAETVDSAWLSTDLHTVRGQPYSDIGPLVLEEVRFDEMAPELWDLEMESGGMTMILGEDADTAGQTLSDGVDLTALVQSSIDDGRSLAQVRLFLDGEGDDDDEQDMVHFSDDDVNVNSPGSLTLTVTVR